MNEPVAWLWTKDGKPQSALLHEPMTVPSDPYWKDKGFKAIPLYTHLVKELTDKEIELLETEIFVKDAILKSYKEALEQIATGEITNESTNYKDTVYVMRKIASDALAILRKAQEKC